MEIPHLLTWEEAKTRASIISDVKYSLALQLSKEDTFTGTCVVSFSASQACDTWLEYKGTSIDTLQINSSASEIVWEGWKLKLRLASGGEYTVEVSFTNKYVNDGMGLHKFIDPEDNELYLYTQFAPFAANKMFPCFDQPDLKAPLSLSVECPSDWVLISNELASVEEKATSKLHTFAPTVKLSTYLYALCAGPFASFRNDQNQSGVPLGLYCRKSLAKYMMRDLLFDWTLTGLKYYTEFFGSSYPFSKYDQVFVPEFNFGAMENAGCVTFRDQYLFRDQPSQLQLTRLSNTVLHEMAHMWFGDLVTMKWWDDLWLNESFATFMSHICISSSMDDPRVWPEFLSLKGWGYSTDQLSTTHPIWTPVKDTDETMSNFDGISYAKGSAVLKQLYFLVGPEVFCAAMQEYMRDLAFANAEFDDLIRYVATEAEKRMVEVDIRKWAEEWVRTSGLNELEPILEFDDDSCIQTFEVKQSPASADHPTLRNHRLIVEVFADDGSSLKKEAVNILPQETTSISQFQGLKAACVLMNVEDWAYCKIRIDQRSVNFLGENMQMVKDALSRQLIWRALYDMVLDFKMSGAQFIESAITQLTNEVDSSVANYILEIGSNVLSSYISESPHKQRFAHSLFKTIQDKIRTSSAEDSVIYQKKLLLYCYTEEDVREAVECVKSKSDALGYQLTQADRWRVIKKFAEMSTDAAELLEEELKTDPSDTGQLAKLYIEAAYPTPEAKSKVWEVYMTKCETLSRYERENSMAGFNRGRQKELLQSYSDLFFQSAVEFLLNKDKEVSKDFCELLMPSFLDDDVLIQKINELIPQVPQDRFEVIRGLKETIDLTQKHSRGRALSDEYLSRT